MRAYFFGNMYLSSIQQGIQAAHVVSELFNKYSSISPKNVEQRSQLTDWAANHKTMILLNAGYASEIQLLCEFFDHEDNPYPYAYFREEKDALNSCLTSIGIILPEKIYETIAFNKSGVTTVDPYLPEYRFNEWEGELIQRLPTYGLAR